MSDPQPARIGKYQLTDVIGEGAMGVVYRAFDPVLERYVAIKQMSPSVAREVQLRDRFLREARAAGSLQHPNVVTIYDFGEVDGHLFIAMEYIPGADLSEIIERRDPLPLANKIDIMLDVLNGLSYAHSRGIVHRDIKPGNVRVSEQGHAKLMDFGIAHLTASNLTQSGVMVGTPNYMAPEQVTGEDVSPATDIFAIGAVLYELVSYARPFQGETLHTVLYKVVSEEPPVVTSLIPGLPPGLEPILAKAMAKKSGDRYPNADAMAKELTALRLEITGGAPVKTVVRATPLHTIAPAGVLGGRWRRSPWVLGGIAAGVVAAAGLGWLAMRDGRGAAPLATPVATPDSAGVAIANAQPAAQPTPAVTSPPVEPRVTTPATSAPTATPSTPAPRLSSPPPSTAAPPRAAAPVPRPDSVLHALQSSAASARARAAARNVSAADLETGDDMMAHAESLAAAGRVTEAAVEITRATTFWANARAQADPAPAVQAPAPSPTTPPAPTPAADPRPEIERIVVAYARALQTREVDRVRAAYPGLTAQQRQGWEQFFRTVDELQVTLTVSRLQVEGDGATGTISGSYDYQNRSTGRHETQAVTFQASFERRAGEWVLAAIR